TLLTNLRVELKKKAKIDPIFENKQKAVKVLNNSIYGTFGFDRFRFHNGNIVNATTLTGQFLIKTASVLYSYMIRNNRTDLTTEEYINAYRRVLTMFLETDVTDDYVLYSDTDSVDGNSMIHSDLGDMPIAQLFDRAPGTILETAKDVFIKRVHLSLFTKVFDLTTRKIKESEITHIRKHNVKKRMFRVVPKGRPELGVIVTEDHSLMVLRGIYVIPVKPSEMVHGDRLVILNKNNPLNPRPDSYFTDDFEITDLGVLNKTVYDITVDHDDHTFFANDILVHNSVFIDSSKVTKNFMDDATNKINTVGWKTIGQQLGFRDVYLMLDYKGSGSVYFTPKKKKYATNLIEDGQISVTGLDSKVSSYPLLTRQRLNEIIDDILVKKLSLSQIRDKVAQLEDDFRNRILRWDPSICSTVTYNKKAESYKKAPAHVIAMEIFNILIKHKFSVGMKGKAYKVKYETSRIPPDKMSQISSLLTKLGAKSWPNVFVIPQDETNIEIPDYIIPDLNATLQYVWTDRIDYLLSGIEQKQETVDLTFDF
ncbi:MAG: DNA polymerase domain-containing protein, partial [Conexivisphaerales archaeon]